MSNNHLLICDKSKLDFELGIIVARKQIRMNTSTDMEPKSMVGGDISPLSPLDPPLKVGNGGLKFTEVIFPIQITSFNIFGTYIST